MRVSPHRRTREGSIITYTTSYSERCLSTLESALTRVPFYRTWSARDPGGSRPLLERLAAFPILSKREVRSNVPHGFMDEEHARGVGGFAAGEVEMVTTSGTSEERLSVVWHQPWWDLSEREGARMHPVLDRLFETGHREAVLTSPLCAGNLCHVGDASMEERTIDTLLFLNQTPNPASWGERAVRRMAEELDRFHPEILEADPAYLALFARGCQMLGIAPFQPECIVFTYEFPSRLFVRAIERVFPDVPLVSSYGSTETGHVFTQCEHGTFHQNTRTCFVEMRPFRPGRGDPAVGRLLVSTLDNPWFTLLRFDTGDCGRLAGSEPCPCGRTEGMSLSAIEGRVRDLTFDTMGRAVTVKKLDDALCGVSGLSTYQVEQTAEARYLARFVAEGAEDPTLAIRVVERLMGVYGADARVETRRETAIVPEQSGKFRLARASLPVRAEELFV